MGPLGLIGDIGKFEDGYEKSVLNKVYERMSVKTLKDYILKGSSGSDKYNYTTREKRSSRYTIPIKKDQAYTNPQILIDYVLKAVNDRENPPIDSDALLNRLSFERIGEYYNIDEGKITQAGVKALLYSLGYLEGATAGSSKEVRS